MNEDKAATGSAGRRRPADLLIEALGGKEAGARRQSLLEAARAQLRSPGDYTRAAKGLSQWLAAKGRAEPRARVYVTGNCTLKPLAEAVQIELFARGIAATATEGGFDRWALDLHDPGSPLYRFEPTILVVYLSSLGLTRAATAPSLQQLEALDRGLAEFRRHSGAPIVIILPELLEEEYDSTSPLVGWRRQAITAVEEIAARLSGVTTVDPAPVVGELGRDAWFAPRFWYHGKFPAHPQAMLRLGRLVGATVRSLLERTVKVVACDLDNTLWGGVVGEDGPAGLELDVHGSGGPYLRLQAFLKRLAERGTVLVAVSKNNEADVREVFEQRRELLLGWDDFAVVRANWRSKADNLLEIADELRLSLRHFCLVDDSPAERAEVRQRLPAVLVPELPAQAEEVVSFLARSGIFQAPVVTAEDRARPGYYRAERQRLGAERAAATLADFLAGLELRAEAREITDRDLPRVTQLVGKTNQFNLTTRRHGTAQLRRLAEDPDVYSFCFRVADRFGDSGLTGVLIAVPEADSTYEIDTWLLSCRVLGRTIEDAMFAHLCSWLRRRRVATLLGSFVAAARNAPVSDLLPRLGFETVSPAAPGTDGTAVHYRLAPIPDGSQNRFVELASAPPPSPARAAVEQSPDVDATG